VYLVWEDWVALALPLVGIEDFLVACLGGTGRLSSKVAFAELAVEEIEDESVEAVG
jgi:hypothetical protein